MIRIKATVRIRVIIGLALIGCFLGSLIPSGPVGAGTADQPAGRSRIAVEIRSPVELDGPTILMKEIAGISGEDENRVELLGNLEIGKAPLPGRSRKISLDSIRISLRRAKVDLSSVDLRSPDSIVVKTRYIRVTRDELVSCARDYLSRTMPWSGEGVSIEPDRVPDEVLVPVGDIEVRGEGLPTTRYLGTTSVRVVVLLNGGPFESITVSMRIRVTRPVAVASRTIERHEQVSKEMIRFEKRDLSELPRNVATGLEGLTGKRAIHTIQGGRLITFDMVEAVPVVVRGDAITVLVKAGNVVVSGRAEALQDGAEGAVIRARNMSSRKVMRVKVVNVSTAEVVTG